MITLISPAKSLNLDPIEINNTTSPLYKKKAAALVSIMQDYDAAALGKLMKISDKLAILNEQRFKNFKSRYTKTNSKAAVLTFDGDVYRGLDASSWDQNDLDYAQDNLRILSGLYGILRPLDMIQPYRLEMGSSIKTLMGNGLYKFWDDEISKHLNKALKSIGQKRVINLASNEYFKAVNLKTLKADILNINFREYRDGKSKFISYSAKVARGLMANYLIKNRIENSEEIKGFNTEGYYYDGDLSTEDNWIFSR